MRNWRNQISKEILLKYISQTILRELKTNEPKAHRELFVGAKDRKYQLWERNPFSVLLYTQEVIEQKINYIHFNPVNPKWSLTDEPQQYKYSSAKFYYEEIDEFDFLENYMDL